MMILQEHAGALVDRGGTAPLTRRCAPTSPLRGEVRNSVGAEFSRGHSREGGNLWAGRAEGAGA